MTKNNSSTKWIPIAEITSSFKTYKMLNFKVGAKIWRKDKVIRCSQVIQTIKQCPSRSTLLIQKEELSRKLTEVLNCLQDSSQSVCLVWQYSQCYVSANSLEIIHLKITPPLTWRKMRQTMQTLAVKIWTCRCPNKISEFLRFVTNQKTETNKWNDLIFKINEAVAIEL